MNAINGMKVNGIRILDIISIDLEVIMIKMRFKIMANSKKG
jgi:hypothetical protein